MSVRVLLALVVAVPAAAQPQYAVGPDLWLADEGRLYRLTADFDGDGRDDHALGGSCGVYEQCSFGVFLARGDRFVPAGDVFAQVGGVRVCDGPPVRVEAVQFEARSGPLVASFRVIGDALRMTGKLRPAPPDGQTDCPLARVEMADAAEWLRDGDAAWRPVEGLDEGSAASDDLRDSLSQLDLNECAAQERAAADAEVEAAYAALRAALGADQRPRLAEAHRQWQAFRDADCALEATAFEGGQAQPMVRDGCHAGHARTWAARLRDAGERL